MRFLIALGIGLATLWGGWPTVDMASAQSQAKDAFQLGQEYESLPEPRTLAEPDDGRIEAVLFFWYGCPHCYTADARLSAWAAKLPADVRFLRLPVLFNDQIEFHARIFMTLESLGYGQETHLKVFRIFQDEGRFINTQKELAGLAKDLKIDPQAFMAAFNSQDVQARMTALNKLMTAYDLPGVPAMVVAGRYRFDIGTARGVDGFIKVADFLIRKERGKPRGE